MTKVRKLPQSIDRLKNEGYTQRFPSAQWLSSSAIE
jgi:hypothetical protein